MGLPFHNLDKNLTPTGVFARAAPQYCVQRIWGPLEFLRSTIVVTVMDQSFDRCDELS